MGSIKTMIIAFFISFCGIIFVTSSKVRERTFTILNHKIGKSHVRIANILVVLLVVIMIFYSFSILKKAKFVVDLMEKKK